MVTSSKLPIGVGTKYNFPVDAGLKLRWISKANSP